MSTAQRSPIPTARTVAGLGRALHVLDAIAGHAEGIGVNQLSIEISEPPASAYRILTTLAEWGVVAQDVVSKRYRLGPATLRWAQAYIRQNPIASVAQPLLSELSAQVSESVFLTELIDDKAICVATAESGRPLRVLSNVGQRMPWHAAASARAILAFREGAEVERLLQAERMQRFTAATHTDMSVVLKDLSEIRASGYAFCDEELEVGVSAVAVPVRSASGEVEASLAVVAPAVRLDETRRMEIVSKLCDTVAELERRLGSRPSAPPR